MNSKEYESVCVLHPTMSEQDVEADLAAVQALISGAGGEILEVERWGRRRLAYEIERVHEGIYTFVRFKAPSTVLNDLDRRYRLNERLLRHLTILSDGPHHKMDESAEGEGRDGRDGREDRPRHRVIED